MNNSFVFNKKVRKIALWVFVGIPWRFVESGDISIRFSSKIQDQDL